MKAVIQRVIESSVIVDGIKVGEINKGLTVLIGAEKGDNSDDADYIIKKITGLRIFPDCDDGKMDLSLQDIMGEVLIVSQFTLVADVSKGRRPSFADSEEPERAKELIATVVDRLKMLGLKVAEGVFGADMKVSIINDGPVTITLDSRNRNRA